MENVHAIEKTDDMVQYEKIDDTSRIDVFDASVFACIRMLNAEEKVEKAMDYIGKGKGANDGQG